MSLTLKQIYDRCEEFGNCLLWRQSCTPTGYPRLKEGYAHIKAWECVHGPVPEGKKIRRTCDETRCCSVPCMVLVTRSQQNRIAAAQGAWKGPSRIAAITRAARARSKINTTDVQAIRSSKENGVVLAKRYAVSRSLISLIRRGRAWRESSRGASVFSFAGVASL